MQKLDLKISKALMLKFGVCVGQIIGSKKKSFEIGRIIRSIGNIWFFLARKCFCSNVIFLIVEAFVLQQGEPCVAIGL
jgi:hypothetical protein